MKAHIAQEQIRAIAARTEDAYSFNRYASWPAIVAALLGRGYTEAQIESILRSKLTRWAADQAASSSGRATTNDLLRFIDGHPDEVTSLLREDGLVSS